MTEPVRNWAGNITYSNARIHRPSSVDDLRRLVAGSERLRVLGTGHSFNRITDTDGDLVSLAGLPPVVRLDRDARTVTVSGGLRYGDFVASLHEQGYALPTLASLPHINVVGACVTGTHGSGDHTRNLATAVSAMELVTADGELVRLKRDTDGDRFAGAVVNLGALGVVTSLTLDLVETFAVRQIVYDDLPTEQARDHWAEIFSSAYSVSMFTDWRDDRLNLVWVKLRDDDEPPPEPWFGAQRADKPRHPIPGMPPENCTIQLGAIGAWHERLPHFRLEFTPSAGDELQSEYLLSRADAVAAFDALDRVRDRIAPVLQICEMRTIAADDLWLSGSYRRDSVAFHFTWVKDEVAVAPVVAAVEEALAPFDVRPHWGKVFGMSAADVSARYERWQDFRNLRSEFDPAGKFGNDFVDTYVPR